MNIRLKISGALLAILIATGAEAKSTSPLSAPGGFTGVGIILGDPTGLTLKHWLDGQQAFDLGLAYSFSDFLLVYGDYLFHFPGAFGNRSEFVSDLSPYVGAGLALFVSNSGPRREKRYYTTGGSQAGVGLRIPLGVEWRSTKTPFGVFVEIVPGMGIIPSTFGFVQGGIGARLYF